MPPRLPTRAFSALPISHQAVASSSTLPPLPPRSSSQRQQHSRAASPRSSPIQHFTTLQSRPSISARGEQKRSFHSTPVHRASAKNPYEVLGVAKDASAADIKKSYYALAKKWHPDSSKEKDAKERFHEIQNAYDILSDDSKRQAYDRYGSASTQDGFDSDAFARGAGGFGGFQDFGSAFGGRGGNAGDLFEQLFGSAFGAGQNPFGGGGPGGAGPRSRPVRGDDLEAGIALSFLEACNGATRKITISPVVDCKPCTGTGLKPGQKKTQCATCKGTGQQMYNVQGMLMASTCSACGGAGSTIPKGARCGECDGVGRVKEKKEVDVEIPAGVEDGMMIRMPGAGDMPLSASGPPGDLLVRVSVRPSTVFRRQGVNLYHDARVPLHTALLGGVIRIPTLEGDVDVKVKGGTQNGEEAVLRGRGVKSVYGRGRNERGDLIVAWKIQIPRSLTPFQRKILQAYADDLEGRHPQITFGPPPSSSSTTPPASSSSSINSNGETRSSSASSSSSPPRTESERSTYTRPPPSSTSGYDHEQDSSSSSAGGVVGTIASVVGGAIGWVERLLGGSGGDAGDESIVDRTVNEQESTSTEEKSMTSDESKVEDVGEGAEEETAEEKKKAATG
ncbi:chaperone DnaJ [Kwoniella newhampshirensis]|uniref:DnaJ homolog 1, mitochondrial n=1 Tax=Kwoniella newhampshirensis TaxID=1651941 RepID=A0AAW0Z4N3_9TREE